MVTGLELMVGVREDAQYGQVMVAGLGGVAVDVLNDGAVRLLPVDEAMAAEMLASLWSAALLGESRGRQPRDIARPPLRAPWRDCRGCSSTIARSCRTLRSIR